MDDPTTALGKVEASLVTKPLNFEQRIETLDILRGFCLFGILLINCTFQKLSHSTPPAVVTVR